MLNKSFIIKQLIFKHYKFIYKYNFEMIVVYH